MAFPARQLVVRLAKRPVGMVQAGRDLVLDREAAVPSPSALPDGHVLVRNLWLSLDPAMRGWMTDAKSYIPPVELGAVMRGGTIGEVVASKSEGYKPGQVRRLQPRTAQSCPAALFVCVRSLRLMWSSC